MRLLFQSTEQYLINVYCGCGEMDTIVSNNLEAPHFVLHPYPAQLRPGGLQVF